MRNRLANYWQKIKTAEAPIYWFLMAITIGLLGFGLGRLSKIETSKPELIIEPASLATNPTLISPEIKSPAKSVVKEGSGITTGQVVASKNGTKYHLPTCAGAKQIKEANKIWFATPAAARAAGYAPAANCPGLK